MNNELPEVWPTGFHVLIEVDKVEDKTSGGLFLPANSRDDQQRKATMATILRLGPDASIRLGEAMNLQPGCRIVFSRYGGFDLLLDKAHDYRLINDEDVLAVVMDK